MSGKTAAGKVPVSDASSKDELSRLKAEYEEVVAKSKGPNDGKDPGGGPATGSDGDGSEDEFEEITVIENWTRFFKANAELLVLYGLIEVTKLREQPARSPCAYCPLLHFSFRSMLITCFGFRLRCLPFHTLQTLLRTRKLLA